MVESPCLPPLCLGFNTLVATFHLHFAIFHLYFLDFFPFSSTIKNDFFIYDLLTHVFCLCPYFHYLIFVYIFSNYFHPIMIVAKVSRECFRKCDTCLIFLLFLRFLFMDKLRILIYGFNTYHVFIP